VPPSSLFCLLLGAYVGRPWPLPGLVIYKMNEFNDCTCKAGNAIAEFVHFAEEKDYNIATLLIGT
jgi:hypothetical protein